MDESTSLLPDIPDIETDNFSVTKSIHQSDRSEQQPEQQPKFRDKFRLRLGYGCGHAQNDLCAAMYFSYLLVYLEGAGLTPVQAGIVLIAGQLVDGISTPIVGYLSDHLTFFDNDVKNTNYNDDDGCCLGLCGKRKAWYMFGLIMVSSTFWALFTPYPKTMLFPPVVYYSIANCLFQVGWASVQVSHMSLVPELTTLKSERIILNAIRFAVTVGTSITIYVMVWLLPSDIDGDITNNPEGVDAHRKEEMLLLKLQLISYIVLLIGAMLGLVFIILVKEERQKKESGTNVQGAKPHQSNGDYSTKDARVRNYVKKLSLIDSSAINLYEMDKEVDLTVPPKSPVDWLKTPGFFGVLANYLSIRLCVNTLQIYLPFFVLYTISTAAAVATVPLTAFVGMCISSALAPRCSALIKDAAYLSSFATACLLVGSCIVFISPTGSYVWVSTASLVLGLSCAQLMVTSQTQICELVGSNSNGGIVFGINSLADKFSTGLVIYGIQQLAQSIDKTKLGGMYEKTATLVPLICALLGSTSLMSVPKSIRDRRANACNS